MNNTNQPIASSSNVQPFVTNQQSGISMGSQGNTSALQQSGKILELQNEQRQSSNNQQVSTSAGLQNSTLTRQQDQRNSKMQGDIAVTSRIPTSTTLPNNTNSSNVALSSKPQTPPLRQDKIDEVVQEGLDIIDSAKSTDSQGNTSVIQQNGQGQSSNNQQVPTSAGLQNSTSAKKQSQGVTKSQVGTSASLKDQKSLNVQSGKTASSNRKSPLDVLQETLSKNKKQQSGKSSTSSGSQAGTLVSQQSDKAATKDASTSKDKNPLDVLEEILKEQKGGKAKGGGVAAKDALAQLQGDQGKEKDSDDQQQEPKEEEPSPEELERQRQIQEEEKQKVEQARQQMQQEVATPEQQKRDQIRQQDLEDKKVDTTHVIRQLEWKKG